MWVCIFFASNYHPFHALFCLSVLNRAIILLVIMHHKVGSVMVFENNFSCFFHEKINQLTKILYNISYLTMADRLLKYHKLSALNSKYRFYFFSVKIKVFWWLKVLWIFSYWKYSLHIFQKNEVKVPKPCLYGSTLSIYGNACKL